MKQDWLLMMSGFIIITGAYTFDTFSSGESTNALIVFWYVSGHSFLTAGMIRFKR